MASFLGFVLLVTTSLVAFISLGRVVSNYFFPNRARPLEALNRSVENLGNWLFYQLPLLALQALGVAYAAIRSNLGFILTILLFLVVGASLYPVESEIQNGVDAVQTKTFLPVWNNIILTGANGFRVAASGLLILSNLVGSVLKIIVGEGLSISVNCDAMDWTAIPKHLGEFANSTLFGPVEVLASNFEADLNIGRPLNNLADAISELLPLVACQCEDFLFIWPALIHPNFGIIQSKHLHQIPDIAINFQAELFLRQPIDSGVSVAKRIGGLCNNPPGNQTERECRVTRGPNFDRAADFSCLFLSHHADFLDDAVDSVVQSLAQPPFGVSPPWGTTPRIAALIAPPFCAITDFAYLTFDAFFHLDLFIFLSSSSGDGNYAAEIRIERPFSRLYNFTTIIENIGVSLGGSFPENFFCAIGTTLRLPIRIIELGLKFVRGFFARGFDLDYFASLGPLFDQDIIDLEDDAEALGVCASNLDSLLGHGGKNLAKGFSLYGARIVRLVKEIIENSRPASAVLLYFSTSDFQTRLDDIFEADKIVWGALGGFVRQLGAFGSVQCFTRDVSMDPDDITNIESQSMHLNIMCAIGTFIEMSGRVYTAVLEYIADAVAGIMRLVGSGGTTFQDFISVFQSGGEFDIGRQNGIIENQCLLADATAMLIPSLMNLGPNRITCVGSGAFSDERLFDFSRAIFRLSLAPFFVAAASVRSIPEFLQLNSPADVFSTWCDAIVLPYWKALVVPNVQLLIASTELIGCFIPDSGPVISSITIFVGQNFISTNYGNEITLPCSEIVNGVDGGNIINVVCTLVEGIVGVLEFLINFFEKGLVAIWELVSGPIAAILEGFIAFFDCILNNIVIIFDSFDQIGAAFADFDFTFSLEALPDGFGLVDYIEGVVDAFVSVFGQWTECEISIDFEEYGPNNPLPGPVTGIIGATGPQELTYAIPTREMVGVCEVDGSCIDRPGTTFPLNTLDFDGQQCVNFDAGPQIPGTRIFHIGVTCSEIQSVSYQSYLDDAKDEVGACCVPSAQCQNLNYSQCNDIAFNNDIKSVWVPNELCSALNNVCRVQNSPRTTQLGCCLSEANKNPLDTNLRAPAQGKSGWDCFFLNGNGANTSSIYIPGDATCSYVQSLPIYNSLLTEEDANIEPLIISTNTELTVDPCTPEEYIFRYAPLQRTNMACGIRSSAVPVPPVSRDINARTSTVTRIAGTGYSADIASFWNCRDDTDWMQGNNFPPAATVTWEISPNPDPTPIGKNWNRYRSLVGSPSNWFFPEYDLFPTPSAVGSTSFALREQLLYRDYDVQCRQLEYDTVTTSTGFPPVFTVTGRIVTGAWQDCALGNCPALTSFGVQSPSLFQFGQFLYFTNEFDTANLAGSLTVEDCRFRARPFTTVPPIFDNADPLTQASDIEKLDQVSGKTVNLEFKTMLIAFPTNTTYSPINSPKDLLRDNTDGRCSNYVPPDYSTPVPVTTTTTGTTGTTGMAMSPDEYYEVPVYSESDVLDSSGDVQVVRRGAFPNPAYYPNTTVFNETDPCAYIKYLLTKGGESEGTRFLLGKEYMFCKFSGMAARVFDVILGAGKNDRYIHPLWLSDGVIHYLTIWKMTKAIGMSISYNTRYSGEFILNNTNASYASNSTLAQKWAPNATSWTDYASQRNVNDPLSLRIGSLITKTYRMMLWLDFNKVKRLPTVFRTIFTGIRYSLASADREYAALSEQRYLPAYNGSELPPTVTDEGWEAIQSLFNFSWFEASQRAANYDNLTRVSDAFTNLNQYMAMTTYAAVSRRFNTNPSSTLHGVTSLAVMSDPMERAGSGGAAFCDPTDDACFKCAIVKNSLTTIIELVLNTVEDLSDDKRFTLDIWNVDLTRPNTFFQPGDFKKCSGSNVSPINTADSVILETIFNVTDLVTGSDIRLLLGRIRCHVTNTDEDDIDSPVAWLNKFVTCDPLTDGSASRGRAGLGLENAILYVTVAVVAFFLISRLLIPLPTFWISIALWALLVIFVAYWWSPACGASLFALATGNTWAIPFTGLVLPDALPDDLFMWLYNLFPKNCTRYPSGLLEDDTCNDSGRQFPDCFKDYGFDLFGTKHVAFLVSKYFPFLRTIFEGSVFPLLGAISPAFDYSSAFNDIDVLLDTPVGDYCLGLAPSTFSILRAWPLLVGLPQLALLSGIAIALGLLYFAFALGIYYFANIIADVLINAGILISKRDRNWRLVWSKSLKLD